MATRMCVGRGVGCAIETLYLKKKKKERQKERKYICSNDNEL